MHERLSLPFRLAAGAAALAFCTAAGAAQRNIAVTIENLAPDNSLSFTPLQLGFGNGSFDPFDSGSPASAALIPLAELGDGTQWQIAFAAADATATRGQIARPISGFLPPGTSTSAIFSVDTAVNRYFTFGAMVLPSNDFFIGNDSPTQYELFDAAGNLAIASIVQKARQIWDAGSEVFSIANAPFVGSTPAAGLAQGGNVSNEIGGSPAFLELAGFDGLTTGAGYTFTGLGANDAERDVYRISFQVVPEPASLALLLPGLLAVGWVGRRRRQPGAEVDLSPV